MQANLLAYRFVIGRIWFHICRSPESTLHPFLFVFQYCGFGMFIPEPIFFHPGSASKNIHYFNPKNNLISFRKYVSGCSSRLRSPDPDFDFLLHPGSQIQGSKRHRIPDPIRNTGFHLVCFIIFVELQGVRE